AHALFAARLPFCVQSLGLGPPCGGLSERTASSYAWAVGALLRQLRVQGRLPANVSLKRPKLGLRDAVARGDYPRRKVDPRGPSPHPLLIGTETRGHMIDPAWPPPASSPQNSVRSMNGSPDDRYFSQSRYRIDNDAVYNFARTASGARAR